MHLLRPSARRVFLALTLAVGVASPALSEAPISAQRQQELLYLLHQDCGSCHGLTLKGGLGSPLLPVNLADKSDAALVEIIMQGLPGTPMPPWQNLLKKDEAAWMVRVLKSGNTVEATQ